MSIQEFVTSLRERQVKIKLVDEQLSIKTSGNRLSDELLTQIRSRKEEIIQYLRAAGQVNGHITAIVPQEECEVYPISFAQRRLWVTEQFSEAKGAYNMPFYFTFEGLNRTAFERTMHCLVDRHEILRTTFETLNGEQVQRIHRPGALGFSIQYADLRAEADPYARADEYRAKDARVPFDLEKGPLLRCVLLHLAGDNYGVIVNFHHIIFDGWSKMVLDKEFNAIYQFFTGHRDQLPVSPALHYKDYSAWQAKQSGSGAWDAHRNYWHRQFREAPAALQLITDNPRPANRSYAGGGVNFMIDAATTNALKTLCQEEGATLFMGLLAVTNVLLYRYTAQTSIVIGTPIAGRDRIELEDQIGFYVNTLALSTQFQPTDSFSNVLKKVMTTTLGAYEHQQYPFDLLVDELGLTREMNRTPLFDVMVLLHNVQSPTQGNIREGQVNTESGVLARFDITFNYTESTEGVLVDINYATDLFSQERMVRMAHHLQQLLQSILARPAAPVHALNYLSEEERHKLLSVYTTATSRYPADKSIVELFEQQVAVTPYATAVVFDGQPMSYKALSVASSQLAQILVTAHGVRRGHLVGIMLDRSLKMVVAMMAILKAGAAYLPLDPAYPADRRDYMLEDANVQLLVSDENIDGLLAQARGAALADHGQHPVAEDAAYVMYTSGSTGRPKATVVTHRNVVRLVKQTNYATFSQRDRLLQTGSLSFDAATFEFYGMLLNGGEVHLLNAQELMNTAIFKQKLLNDGITVMWLTASWLNQLVDEDITIFAGLKQLLTGGEKLSPAHINKLQRSFPNLRIINGYGPTENTTFSICKDIRRHYRDDIPLGTPIANSCVYILDEYLQPVAEGIAGEIFLGGDGLAAGYLNRPELTAEKFIRYTLPASGIDCRLYKSGDIGCWLPGGEVRFLGRKDEQVKIRGYRIEPGEIEALLKTYPGLQQAVVMARTQEGNEKYLAAYITGQQPDAAAVKAWLAQRVPFYMVPAHIITLATLPLTGNGKIDRAALPDPLGAAAAAKKIVALSGDTEQQLAAIWQEVLKKDTISAADNFFEIGGQSLKAMQVLAKVYQQFGQQLSLGSIFENPVLRDMAALLAQPGNAVHETISCMEEQEHYPLSNAQHRLWVIDQFDETRSVYNIPYTLSFRSLDMATFRRALETIVARHEALRTVFIQVDGEPRQRILDVASGFSLEYTDLRNAEDKNAEVKRRKQEAAAFAFDLSTGPLIRVALLQLEDQFYKAVINLHHIVSDGWSREVMEREFSEIYENTAALQPLPVQYKDYAAWQRDMLEKGAWDDDRIYWHQHLENLPVLELPTDFPRPARRTYEGAGATVLLGASLSNGLTACCEQEGITLFMGLLACTSVLLYRSTGAEDMVIGTPVAGRDRAELEDQIGFYVNTLPLHCTFSAAGDFKDLLAHVKQVTLEGYKRQQYPFDLLVNELEQTWSINRSPVFDVMMDIQNFREENVTGVPQADEAYSFDDVPVKFDLNFTFVETSSGILLHISYSKSLFAEQTIRAMVSHFVEAVQSLVDDPRQPIAALGVLTQAHNQLPDMERMLQAHAAVASAAIIPYQDRLVAWYEPRQTAVEAVATTALTCRATTAELAIIDKTNETDHAYDEWLPVHTMFEQAAALHAERTALACGDTLLTYRQLNEKANQLAHFINSRYKVKKQNAIGMLVARSEQMVISALAILKLGAVYVPVDTDYPAERINYMLDEAGVVLLVTSEPFAAAGNYPQVVLSSIYDQLDECRDDDPEVTPAPDKTAYIMFTSGTTGKPKGVVISHESFADYTRSFIDYFGVCPGDVMMQQSSVSFDTSVEEIFGILCAGGKMVVLPGGGRDIDGMMSGIISHGATLLSTTPLVINELNAHEDRSSMRLRALIAGGDRLQPAHIDKLINEVAVYNTYGPTESTICATYGKVNSLAACGVIGFPIRNRQVYLLNAALEEAGIGMQGEIYIGGKGLAREYLNRPEETQAAFVQHPAIPGMRLYKTGDIGRRMADGGIAFIGRKDRQVKVRGYRIELVEVEQQVAAVEGVDDAVVAARADGAGNHQLIAFYTSAAGIDKNVIWQQLHKLLPVYMVPAHIVPVQKFAYTSSGKIDHAALPYPAEQAANDPLAAELKQLLAVSFGEDKLPALFIRASDMPLTANGKADRRQLQKMTKTFIADAEYQAPASELEAALAVIWKEVLGQDRIGVTDHFFELGGNSIKATRIISRIRKRLGSSITPGMFFDEPTIRGLAAILQRHGTTAVEQVSIAVQQHKHYPVSFAQRRLWVIEQFAEAQGAYNMPAFFEFEHLNMQSFRQAIATLINHHEILRTTFDIVEGEPVQKVWEPGALPDPVIFTDLRGQENAKARAREIIDGDMLAPFNLVTGPLLRINVVQLSGEQYWVLFNQHHIISDGWSMQVVEREFNGLYTTFERGEQPALQPLPYQYKDYTLWQLQQLQEGYWNKHRNYWHRQMSGELPVLELPADYPRPVNKRYEGEEVNFVLNRQLRNAFEKLCKDNQATLFMGYLAVVNILLHRYSGQEDIIVGSPIAGRDRIELEDQLGFYANTLALRTQFTGKDSLRQVFDKVREVTLGAYEHQQYPFDLLVDELGLERDVSRMPLFDVMLLSQSQQAPIRDDERIMTSTGNVSKFDMTIAFTDSPGGMGVSILYSKALFSAERIRRMAAHLRELITAMVHCRGSVRELDYLPAAEKKQLAGFAQGHRFDYPSHQTIHGLVAEQAERTPDAIAVKAGDASITYGELHERSGRLANYLKQYHGIRRGHLAGVMVSRNELLPVALLGVLRAGAAYLPLDPAYPQARLDFMKEDAHVQTVITDETLQDERIGQCSPGTAAGSEAGDRAYLIYTSGTTGKPKGVSLSHRNAVALVSWAKREFEHTPADVVFFTTSYCFDLSVYELFYTLASGRQLRVLQNALELPQWIGKENNILINTVPSVVNGLLDQGVDLSNVAALNIAGEPIPATVIDRLDTARIEVRNLYGPSEYATYSTGYLFPAGDKTVLIGRPLHNTEIYILDDYLQPLPIGVKGEIFVSGEHLAEGYLNRPELTAGRFIDHPFAPGRKLYRTGDLGWWREDGNLECIGRKDNQVKLRGFRIELGEIDALMAGCAQVRQAVAVVRRLEDGDQQLVAYYTGDEGAEETIRQYLREKLPQYMVPSFIVHMAAWPLSPNGKVDRSKLPAPGGAVAERTVAAPRTGLEKALLGIWKEVLNRTELGIRDNFFDVGGQSIKAMQLVSRVYHQLGKTISFSDIFRCPNVESLAALLEKPAPEELPAIPATNLEPETIKAKPSPVPSAQATLNPEPSTLNLQPPTSNFQPQTIQPAPLRDHYPVSFAQRRLWVIEQFREAAGVYNMPYVFELEDLDKAVFEKAIQALIARHEVLRTVFPMVNGAPVQKILPASAARLKIKYTDLRGEENPGIRARKLQQEQALHSFDLVKGPLMDVQVLQMQERKFAILLNVHHIISDGWSMDVLGNDFTDIYERISKGEPLKAALPIQYKDYTVWQWQQQSEGKWQQHRTYWMQQFEGELPQLQLPADKPRPAVKRYEGAEAGFKLNTELVAPLQQLCREEGVTLFMALLAVTKALLYRYTGQQDLVIGTAVSGRDRMELESQIGFYVNTLALRTRFSGQDSLCNLLQQVKEITLNAHEHQQYPFDLLVDDLELERDLSRTPLFDVMLLLEQDTRKFVDTGEVTLKHDTVCKFDLTFAFAESAGGISAHICYSTHLYSDERMVRMARHFRQLLSGMLAHPEAPIASIDYLSAQEKEELLVKPNLTTVGYPGHCGIPELFEQQAAQTPLAVAASFSGQPLTYQALSEASGRVAACLVNVHGVRHGEIIALMADRSLEMVITMLGILKAGAAYLPIDPLYPEGRISFMLEDAAVRLIITQPQFAALCTQHPNAAILLIDELVASAQEQPQQTPQRRCGPGDIAYVMYTSGSTGMPKGVMVTNRNIIRLVKSTNYMTIAANDCVLQTGSLSFDASTFEFYAMLLNGGEVCMLPTAELMNPDVLKATLLSGRISILWIATSWLNQLIEQDAAIFARLRCVITGGEKVSAQHLNQLREAHPALQIINAYGPTENAVYSLCKTIDRQYATDIPLGQPISNSTLYILDDNQLPVPKGITGELYVGGEGLAAGYLNKPELTAEKFIGNPFSPGTKLYKTGDLGCWREDGDIDFLGRRDGQVKLRGFRIELGEIDTQLSACPHVRQSITVVYKNANGDQHLVAYYTGQQLEAASVREFLEGRLPQYMVPTYFVHMDAFPVTRNGKTDLKKLPAPELASAAFTRKAPVTETEKILLGIWKEVLKRDDIGTTDNFFQAGGQSIRAMQVVSRAFHKSGLAITFRDVFRLPTVASLAAFLDEAQQPQATTSPAIRRYAAREHYPVSFAQRRLWVIEQFQEAGGAYNMPFVFELNNVDRMAFGMAMQALLERHEILRTVFPMVNGEPVQRILSAQEMDGTVLYEDLRGEEHASQVVGIKIREEVFRSFDLVRGPLIRAKLLQLTDEKYCLVFNQHHIISDGWSMNILQDEFMELYNSIREHRKPALQPLPIQYRDYTLWQLEQLERGAWKEHKAYWMNQFAETAPTLEMPADQPRPSKRTYDGLSTSFLLDKQLSDGLEQLCRRHGCTLFMGLLATINLLLNRYTGQQDIVIGSPITGRDNLELENQLGFYVNTLPLRTRFQSSHSFIDLLQQVCNVTLGAYQHQQYPFDLLVNELGLERDMSRNPLFDVMLSLQNIEEDTSEKAFTEGEFSNTLVKFDLMFTFSSTAGGLFANIRSNSNLFSRERIARMTGHLRQILAWVLQHANEPLTETCWLTASETDTIIHAFNNTTAFYPQDKTIHQLFEEQVEKTPDAVALVYGDEVLSYRMLNAKANQVAHCLRTKHGVTRGSLVALMMDRSHELVIGMLGILKAGAAYVPVDPMYPEKRRQYMTGDSCATVVLSQLESLQPDNYPVENPVHINTPADLIYVIYTSGSTGAPKGVCIRHGAVVNLVQWLTDMVYLPHGKPLTVLLTASTSFDASVKQLFPPLLCGSRLVMIPEKTRTNPRLYVDELEKQQVELLDITPSYLQMVLREIRDRGNCCAPVQYVLAGGEVLQKETALLFHELFSDAKLINVYGPTEATVDATSKFVTPDDVAGIGKPIANARIYILDHARKPVAIGVPGELCIGGEGLAPGYCNRPELTAEKFIGNPFEPGKKLYLTGDLACWKEDGSVEYIGRRDEQVKLRGYRIELAEIEAVLAGHAGIGQAVVALRNAGDGEQQLVAYYTGTELSPEHIRNYLSDKLPQHMIPACLVYLASLPLTPNGKVDRRQLPDPVMTVRKETIAPRTPAEEKLLKVWQQVLEREHIGMDDNFFEIGGHSLKAMQIVSRVNLDMKADISIRELFNHPTIEKLALVITENNTGSGLLIALNRPQEGNVNAFFIPPILGFSTIYRNLASRLQGAVNCYGLQYRGADGSGPYDTSIEAMANSFFDEIVKTDNADEVIVAGYSMGALVAFELTKLLERNGYKVRLLLLDKNVKALANQLGEHSSEESLELYFQREIKPWMAFIDNKDMHHFRHFFRHNLALSGKYALHGKVSADMLAVEAQNGQVRTGMEHWRELTAGNFAHVYAAGAHGDMLKEENLGALLDYIAQPSLHAQ